MAKAVRSLSPKQIQERIQQHRQAVMVLAKRSARKAIEARLKGQGVNVMHVLLPEIMALTNDYLAEHRAFFVVEAKQAIATWPGFTRWAAVNRPFLLNETHDRKSEQMTTIGYARVSTDGQSLASAD
jgi:hypothetical protein